MIYMKFDLRHKEVHNLTYIWLRKEGMCRSNINPPIEIKALRIQTKDIQRRNLSTTDQP